MVIWSPNSKSWPPATSRSYTIFLINGMTKFFSRVCPDIEIAFFSGGKHRDAELKAALEKAWEAGVFHSHRNGRKVWRPLPMTAKDFMPKNHTTLASP